MKNETFLELKPFPKNKKPRVCYITDEVMEIIEGRKAFRSRGNDSHFHVEGATGTDKVVSLLKYKSGIN